MVHRQLLGHSLQARLTWLLLLIVGLTGLIAGIVTYQQTFARNEAIQDHFLNLISAMIDKDDFNLRGQIHWDSPVEDEIFATRLPALNQGPIELPFTLSEGLHTLRDAQGNYWRVYIRTRKSYRVAIAQPTSIRDHAARLAAIEAMAPFLLLLPALGLMAAWLIRSELRPVRSLGEHLAAQEGIPAELPNVPAPRELVPFLQSLRHLMEREHTLRQSQQQFLAAAAHELRSPLTALSLQAENLANASTPDQFKNRLLKLQQGLERTRRSAEQLLQLSRQRNRIVHWEILPFPLFIGQLIDTLTPLCLQQQVEVSVEGTIPTSLFADRIALEMLLRNALDNAIRYSRSGSSVRFNIHLENQHYHFTVLDQGPGIPEDQLVNVWKPFCRLPGHDAHGTGLGLTIIAESARGMQGSVEISNRHDGGLMLIYKHPVRDPAIHNETQKAMTYPDQVK